MSGDFPGFPSLPDAKQTVPLTARSTVTDVSSSGRSAPAPVQTATGGQQPGSNLEHRNKAPTPRSKLKARQKGDPLLTRLLYGALAWFNKVPLEKGYSQVDWMRKSRAAPQPHFRKDITMEEVRRHKTKDDAWMVFRNKVYDITPYVRFHPGGPDILLRAAGKDGTSLFMKYHPWVNIDALMEKCLLGVLAEPTQHTTQGQGTTSSRSPAGSAQDLPPLGSVSDASAMSVQSDTESVAATQLPVGSAQLPGTSQPQQLDVRLGGGAPAAAAAAALVESSRMAEAGGAQDGTAQHAQEATQQHRIERNSMQE